MTRPSRKQSKTMKPLLGEIRHTVMQAETGLEISVNQGVAQGVQDQLHRAAGSVDPVRDLFCEDLKANLLRPRNK